MPGAKSGKEVTPGETEDVINADSGKSGTKTAAKGKGASGSKTDPGSAKVKPKGGGGGGGGVGGEKKKDDKKEEEKVWVEFEVQDASGKGLADEPCIVVLPDGTKKDGLKTNGKGIVRVDNIDPGTATLRLKERYDFEWNKEAVKTEDELSK